MKNEQEPLRSIRFDGRELYRLKAQGKLDPISEANLEDLFLNVVARAAAVPVPDLDEDTSLAEAHQIMEAFKQSGIPILSREASPEEKQLRRNQYRGAWLGLSDEEILASLTKIATAATNSHETAATLTASRQEPSTQEVEPVPLTRAGFRNLHFPGMTLNRMSKETGIGYARLRDFFKLWKTTNQTVELRGELLRAVNSARRRNLIAAKDISIDDVPE